MLTVNLSSDDVRFRTVVSILDSVRTLSKLETELQSLQAAYPAKLTYAIKESTVPFKPDNTKVWSLEKEDGNKVDILITHTSL